MTAHDKIKVILTAGGYPHPSATHQWRDTPPTGTGTFWWRWKAQWEPIQRTIDYDRKIFSHRAQQAVDIERLGGQWFY